MAENQRLKVVIFKYFPPDLGGSATRAFNVAKGLTCNDCDVTVIAAFPHYPDGQIPRDYRWKPFKIEWMGKIRVIRTFIFPLESRGLGRRLILFGTFIVSSLFAFPLIDKFNVAWSSNPDLVAIIPAIIYCEVKRRPMALNVDNLALEDLYDFNLIKRGTIVAKIIELITKMCYMKADLVTPISPGYIETLLKYGVEKRKIHVIEGGVDLTSFKRSSREKRVGAKFVAFYIGSFSLAYNFDQILLAAKVIEKNGDNIEFVLHGNGELVTHVRSKIEELNLKNVSLRNEVISREEVAVLVRSICCFYRWVIMESLVSEYQQKLCEY